MARTSRNNQQLRYLYVLPHYLFLVTALVVIGGDVVVGAAGVGSSASPLPPPPTSLVQPAKQVQVMTTASSALTTDDQQAAAAAERKMLIGSRAPTTCTYNECRGCRHRCSVREVPVDASDPINSAYHYKCVCHI